MHKEQPSKLLNKKKKRKNFSSNKPHIKPQEKKDIIIDIKNSLFSFDDLKDSEKNQILQLNRNKKSNIVKKIEKGKINYSKCNYASKNELSYKCKKIINVPSNLIESKYKPKIFLRLINYNKKNIFLLGYSKNLLIYEIYNNDIYFIYSVFKDSMEGIIDYIFLLNENIMTNKINLFFISNNKGLLYEFDLKDYNFKVIRDNITFYNKDDFSKNYRFKYIKKSKLVIYNDLNIKIYNIIDNQYKDLYLDLDEYENIHNCQKLNDELYLIKSDKKIFIINSLTDSLLYKIETELHFYWVKIILLKSNQFLLYSSSNIDIYDFDYITKIVPPKLNRKLVINNIKFIQKVKQISNNDLIINYSFYNLAIYDLKKNIIKYNLKNPTVKGNNILLHYSNLLEEIEPNIIVYKKSLVEISFLNIIKGENLGKFKEGRYNTIKVFKKIKYDLYGEIDPQYNNNKIFYFILTNNNSFILYK